jgi:hypothetical protein
VQSFSPLAVAVAVLTSKRSTKYAPISKFFHRFGRSGFENADLLQINEPYLFRSGKSDAIILAVDDFSCREIGVDDRLLSHFKLPLVRGFMFANYTCCWTAPPGILPVRKQMASEVLVRSSSDSRRSRPEATFSEAFPVDIGRFGSSVVPPGGCRARQVYKSDQNTYPCETLSNRKAKNGGQTIHNPQGKKESGRKRPTSTRAS